jgi:hypothetical protein
VTVVTEGGVLLDGGTDAGFLKGGWCGENGWATGEFGVRTAPAAGGWCSSPRAWA